MGEGRLTRERKKHKKKEALGSGQEFLVKQEESVGQGWAGLTR